MIKDCSVVLVLYLVRYRATELEKHEKKAESYFKSLSCQYATEPISWDDKSMMVQLHIAFLRQNMKH